MENGMRARALYEDESVYTGRRRRRARGLGQRGTSGTGSQPAGAPREAPQIRHRDSRTSSISGHA